MQQNAICYLSKPVLYKNGDSAGICRGVAFNKRLSLLTGLVVITPEGERSFFAGRFLAACGENAVILKSGAIRTRVIGSFPLGKQIFSPDGSPFSRVADIVVARDRKVLTIVSDGGEKISPDRISENTVAGLVMKDHS